MSNDQVLLLLSVLMSSFGVFIEYGAIGLGGVFLDSCINKRNVTTVAYSIIFVISGIAGLFYDKRSHTSFIPTMHFGADIMCCTASGARKGAIVSLMEAGILGILGILEGNTSNHMLNSVKMSAKAVSSICSIYALNMLSSIACEYIKHGASRLTGYEEDAEVCNELVVVFEQ